MTKSHKKAKVIVTRILPEAIETRMKELFDVELNLQDKPLSQAQLVEAVRQCDILVPTLTDKLDVNVLAQAGAHLKLIANFGNGVDHIDVEMATQKGITVTNTPGVLTEDTADMTLALMLAAPRRIVEGANFLKEESQQSQWQGWSPTWMLGRRFWGKRLGIIGMGRIGAAVARRAKAFGLSIHYHNRHPVHEELSDELEATYWPSLDQMLARMDIISIHCPHTPATYHLLSARRLQLLKREATIINTARGEIIDEQALITMLEDNRLGVAALDVFEHEPAVNVKLLKLARKNKVIVLPHMGSATVESRTEMGEKVLINMRAFLDGHCPPDRVLPSML